MEKEKYRNKKEKKSKITAGRDKRMATLNGDENNMFNQLPLGDYSDTNAQKEFMSKQQKNDIKQETSPEIILPTSSQSLTQLTVIDNNVFEDAEDDDDDYEKVEYTPDFFESVPYVKPSKK